MNKIISIALLAAGIVLIVIGANASNSVGSGFSRFFTGSPTDKTIWLLIGGIGRGRGDRRRSACSAAVAPTSPSDSFNPQPQSQPIPPMLGYAITFFLIALIAGILGFGGIAGTAASIAQVLFLVIFLVLFILSLFRGRGSNVN